MSFVSDCIKNLKACSLAGLVLVAVGCGASYEASQYKIGALSNMGPGFLPLLMGLSIAFIGVVLMLTESFSRKKTSRENVNIRPLVMVALGFFFWAIMVDSIGLIPATAFLVAFAFLAERPVEKKFMVISIVVIPVLGYLLFVFLLKVPLSAVRWPEWIL